MKRIHVLPILALCLCLALCFALATWYGGLHRKNTIATWYGGLHRKNTIATWHGGPHRKNTIATWHGGLHRKNTSPPLDLSNTHTPNALATTSPQDFQRGMRRWGGRRQRDPNDRGGVPLWENESADPGDVFTFVRIRYSSYRGRYRWNTDYPDADLNLSYRLQQLTSIKTDPNGKIIQLTDEELFKYPFIYIIEPGGMTLNEAEVVALREYLNRGGFLMVDDFWGEAEWENFAYEMKRVFPDRPIEDIPLEHEIFNIVYKIKKKPMIPSVHAYRNGYRTERMDAREAHYRCIKDDAGRLMTVICHNTDLGDGWEQEGTDSGYFEEYSEPYAYPLGINIVTYALTH